MVAGSGANGGVLDEVGVNSFALLFILCSQGFAPFYSQSAAIHKTEKKH